MSRAIKFRAKLIKREGNRTKGQWVYGLPQQRVEIHGVVNLNKPAEIGYIVSYEPERMLQSGAPDNNLYWYEIDPETLGQYTGLKDAKGKEIYEGDIVRRGYFALNDISKFGPEPWNNLPEGVKENDITTVTEVWAVASDISSWQTISEAVRSNPDVLGVEVIGNIYENPDLVIGPGFVR